MSVASGPAVSTGNLIFYYDMTNTQKSWKGAPTTNYFTLPTVDVNGFGVQNSTFTRIRNGTYGGYDITPADYVWRYNITGNDCPYHGWDIPTPSGSVVTFSFDYFVDSSCVNYPSNNYLANFENAGSGVGGAYSDPTPSVMGVWKRAYFSSTASATGNSRCLLYPGACGTKLADSGFILYKNPQVEFNAPGGLPTPFVAGTRSSSQALLDLTGRYTLTAANVTYSSNTFAFNGNNSCFDLNTTSLISGTQDFTIEAVYYTSATDTGGREIIGNYGTGATANTLWFATHGLWINGATPYHSGSPLRNGTYYTAATRLGSATSLYKNGALELTGTNSTSIAVGQNWRIGKDVGGDGEPFLGNIYMIRVYNRALNAGEIYQNYNAVRNRYGI